MKKNYTINIIEIIGFSIFFPVVTIGCSFGFAFLEREIGFWLAIAVLGAIIILIPFMVYFAGKIFVSIGKDSISSTFDLNIKEIQDELLQNTIMDGIYYEEHLAIMERREKFEEIWLISPDLRTEIEDGIYAGVVRDNLRKGTKYRYFVPETPQNKSRVKIFKQSCGNNKNLEILYLTNAFFFLVPDVDFAIYEPLKAFSNGKVGYMGLKIQGSIERYAVQMNEDFVDALVAKLDECPIIDR
jgi:hypothetical protein